MASSQLIPPLSTNSLNKAPLICAFLPAGARREIPGAFRYRPPKAAIRGSAAQVDAPEGLPLEIFAHDGHPSRAQETGVQTESPAGIQPTLLACWRQGCANGHEHVFQSRKRIPAQQLDRSLAQRFEGFHYQFVEFGEGGIQIFHSNGEQLLA